MTTVSLVKILRTSEILNEYSSRYVCAASPALLIIKKHRLCLLVPSLCGAIIQRQNEQTKNNCTSKSALPLHPF